MTRRRTDMQIMTPEPHRTLYIVDAPRVLDAGILIIAAVNYIPGTCFEIGDWKAYMKAGRLADQGDIFATVEKGVDLGLAEATRYFPSFPANKYRR
jgi:hypothetical protein